MLLQTEETLLDILSQVFPPTNYDYRENIIDAFGYGSGVLSQQQPLLPRFSSNDDDDHHHHHDNSIDPKMIDLILVVNDVQQFHRENIQHNPQHYNFTNSNDYYYFNRNYQNDNNDQNRQQQQEQRAATITWVQCHSTFFGQSYFSNPGVYFHLVHNNNNYSHQNIGGIKYGIISYQTLLNDLQQWTHLYIAGRMHKPIVRIPIHRLCSNNNNNINNNESTREKQPNSTTPQRCRQVLQSAQEQSNLPAALATALLYQWYQNQPQQSVASTVSTAPSDQSSTTTTTFRDLYQHIVQISYSGDPRMGMFEDTQKIQNIITSQYHHFDQLYQPILQPFIHDGLIHLVTTSSSNTPVNDERTTPGTHDTAVYLSPPEQQQQQTLLSYHWDHPMAHERLWHCLPQRIRQQCRSNNNNMTPYNFRNTSTTSSHDNHQQQQENMSAIRQLQRMISQSIVAPAARYQSLKGLYSTGLRNSIVYLTRKFSKGRLGKQFTSYFTTTPSSMSSRSPTRVPTTIPKKN